MPDRPKGLRGIGAVGRAIWAEAWRGRCRAVPPATAPNPMAAAFFKKSRRLDLLLFSANDMIHTSLDTELFSLGGRACPAARAEVENRLEVVSAHDHVLRDLQAGLSVLYPKAKLSANDKPLVSCAFKLTSGFSVLFLGLSSVKGPLRIVPGLCAFIRQQHENPVLRAIR